MNNDELIKLLESAESRNEPELTDEDVDAILMEMGECSDDRTEEVRKRYIEKILEDLNPIPVKKIEHKTTFGRWIESARNKVKLSSSDIALPLRQEPIFIERIERGEIPPWECEPGFVTEIMGLFRVHYDALSQLVSTSAAVNQVKGVGDVLARSHGGKASKDRGSSTARALELFLANNAAPVEKPEDAVAEWMQHVHEALKERNLNYLVDSDSEGK